MAVFARMLTAALALLLTACAHAKEATKTKQQRDDLQRHWKAAREHARLSGASNEVPVAVLNAIARTSLYSFVGEDEATFRALTQHQTTRTAAGKDDRASAHVACAALANAPAARDALADEHTATEVLYSNRRDDIACWKAALRPSQAATLRTKPSDGDGELFFHVVQWPQPAKINDKLVAFTREKGLKVNPLVFEGGALVALAKPHPEARKLPRQHRHGVKAAKRLAAEWETGEWGLTSGGAHDWDDFFFTAAGATAAHAAWQSVRAVASDGGCLTASFDFKVDVTEDSDGDFLHVRFEAPRTAEGDSCVLAVLAFLATQPEVHSVELPPQVKSLSVVRDKPKTSGLRGSALESSPTTPLLKAAGVDKAAAPKLQDPRKVSRRLGSGENMRPLNSAGSSVLLSGFPYEQDLWAYNITGKGQFVQVTDTGFDDASCWMRDTDSAGNLTGELNTDYQVPRSTWDDPTTDFTKRKVVQYIAYPYTGGDFDFDYEAGHGTHCAGSVAGNIAHDGDYNASIADLERTTGTCADTDHGTTDEYGDSCFGYTAEAATGWSSGYGNWCGMYDDDDFTSNGMCCVCGAGVPYSPEDEKGMAPDAKLMVFDFGDAEGSFALMPNNYYYQLFPPAYDNGARISSNSWGTSSGEYDSSCAIFDEYIYDVDDMLVLVAAGNDGDENGDGGNYGDTSIGQPAVSKNCMTVGAGESSSPMTTVADFSSRGPTLDGRLLPDVIAPGNPLNSARSSGQPGLATCALEEMSGTSMATPALAGAAALVRQYLTEGWMDYYAHEASEFNGEKPSAALLKALLIASTIPLKYGYDSYQNPVELAEFYSANSTVSDSVAYPLGTTGLDYHQGFGEVQVSNVLPMYGSNFETLVFESRLFENDNFTVILDLENDPTLWGLLNITATATLVWTDPPASVDCAVCLVHDLDLKIGVATKSMSANFYESAVRWFEKSTETKLPNFGASENGMFSGEADTVNNVEKAVATGRTLNISVSSGGLAYQRSQKFALVVKIHNMDDGQNKRDSLTVTVNGARFGAPSFQPTSAPTSCEAIQVQLGYGNTDGVYVKTAHLYDDGNIWDAEGYWYSAETGLYMFPIYTYWVVGPTLDSWDYDNWVDYAECGATSAMEAMETCDFSYFNADGSNMVCVPAPTPSPTVFAPTPSPTEAMPTPMPTFLCTEGDTEGQTDSYGDGCAAYLGKEDWCQIYDDSDFSSNDMCCACGGGGTLGTPSPTVFSQTPSPTEAMLGTPSPFPTTSGYEPTSLPAVASACTEDSDCADGWRCDCGDGDRRLTDKATPDTNDAALSVSPRRELLFGYFVGCTCSLE